MKLVEQKKAKILRSKGYSLKQIAKELQVAKSTASVWVRNVSLSREQRMKLRARLSDPDVVEKRRKTRIEREAIKRASILDEAAASVGRISKKDLWFIGTALYWGEGRKTNHGIVGFSNGDPRAIRTMMRFFREICEVPEEKFRGHIHIHPHLDYRASERYWSSVAEIPLKRFYKTYRKQNNSSKGRRRDSLPRGTFDIVVCNTKLLLTICGWIEGVAKKSTGT